MIDLLLIGRKSHEVSFKEALIWTGIWVVIALVFYTFLRFHGEEIHGIKTIEDLKGICAQYADGLKIDSSNYTNSLTLYRENMATEFITGYLIEYTLSMDNVFVIMMILASFSVKKMYYKRVLFWGILGAIVLRCIFIFAGAALIERFEWILYLFGIFLVYSGIKMFITRNKEEKIATEHHPLVRFLSKYLPVFPRYVNGNFIIKKLGRYFITPLFVVLILVEFTDLIFAFDSIPAIFSVTRDPFIVFFSNIFAIIGLRTLFFLLARIVHIFHYLNIGIAFLLFFIGMKLIFANYLETIGFKTVYSLYIIVGVLGITIIASVMFPEKGVKK